MNDLKRHLVTVACLLAAIASYVLGFNPGMGLFLALGACLETVFWVRLLNRRYKSRRRLRDLQAGGQA